MRNVITITFAIILCGCQTASRSRDVGLSLPAIFSDGMVFQRDKPVAVWGKAAPGTRVRVSLNGRHFHALANEAGEFRGYLEALDAGGPFHLSVRAGTSRKIVQDVLVGDVWLCSGQSNMAMSMLPGPRGVLNAEQEAAAANYPTIRLFNVPRITKFEPQDDCAGAAWQACTPESVRDFSAVGYFFGRDLQREINVPIGLINASRGASPAEAWTSGAALERLSEWQPIMRLLPKLIASSAKASADPAQRTSKPIIDLDSLDAGYANGSAVWANPSFDASSWKILRVPGAWEDQGYRTLDGFAWYRKDVVLPASWGAKPLRLYLGGVNDADRTWFNGQIVGEGEGASAPREYIVPENLVHAGRNTIAIRVYDMGNTGGFTGGNADMHLDIDGVPNVSALPLAGDWRFSVGMDIASAPSKPVPPIYIESNQRMPTVLYNGMIAPLVPFALRGVVWYQGEGNVGRARQYRSLFPAMINDWRAAFRQGDLPFLFVQLPNFKAHTDDPNAGSPLAELRDAQAQVSHGSHTGMAVTIDIGAADTIHPRNKQDVSKRLVLLALKHVYGRNVVASGPRLESIVLSGNAMVMRFSNADGGLRTSDGAAPRGFAVAGKDSVYHWAVGHIDGNDIRLTCDAVRAPYRVRYAWADNPDCNLTNAASLPAQPFQADCPFDAEATH